MKIYQIHKYGGEWEDSYDYIVASYLSAEKAMAEQERLEQKEEVLRKCKSCPLYYCEDECDWNCEECNKHSVEKAMEYCDRYESNANEKCVNYYYYGEVSYYKTEEVEVIE